MSVSLTVADRVAVLVLDRPDRRNALSLADWRTLRDLLRSLQPVRAVVSTGAEDHFCAGMDLADDNPLIAELAPALNRGEEAAARRVITELKECVSAITELEVPVFAAIEGACIGGGLEIALACDVRIAASDAIFALPEVRLGMIPDVGGCARMVRLVGSGRTADLVTTGRRVRGDEAFDLGIVERIVPPGGARAAAMLAAADVVLGGPDAVRLALAVVRAAGDLGLDEALAIETHHGAMAIASGEAREGISAFREKRAPRW